MKLRNTILHTNTLKFIGGTLRIAFSPWREPYPLHPYGFGYVTQFLGKHIFDEDNYVEIAHGRSGTKSLRFKLNDPYWCGLLLPWTSYEPELAAILDKVLRPGTVFMDCGANIGYWSIYARDSLPSQDVIAIEPFGPTYRRLVQNSDLNGRFTCIQAAITDHDHQHIRLFGSAHAAMTVVPGGSKPSEGSDDTDRWCETITLDTLYSTYVRPEAKCIVIKLDIEGAEVTALKSAQAILRTEPLIIYEELTKFGDCATSCFLSRDLGYRLFFRTDHLGIQQVSLEEVHQIVSDGKAHNFIACSQTADWTL